MKLMPTEIAMHLVVLIVTKRALREEWRFDRFALQIDKDFPYFRELYGVANQIYQDLPQTGDIAADVGWNAIGHDITQIETLFIRPLPQQFESFLNARAQFKRLVLQIHFT